MSQTKPEEKKLKDPSVSELYLILYNCLQTVGWLAILINTALYLFYYKGDWKSFPGAFERTEASLKFFQSLAMLEVLHIMLGFVKSNPSLTFLQVLSRVVIVWLVFNPVPPTSIGTLMVILAWSITEIVRYLYYAWSMAEKPPYILLWLRYTLFIVLYPLGVAGEIISTYYALPVIKEQKLNTLQMPNQLNWSFDCYTFMLMALVAYLPGFPALYSHMLKQRGKYLREEKLKEE